MIYEGLGHATHQPWLALAVARTQGSIIEFGAGHFSTPLLHVASDRRDIYTLENDEAWHAKFAPLQSAWHKIVMVRHPWETFLFEPLGPFGLAFVDCHPGEDRVAIIKRLKGHAKLILAHDTEADIPPSAGAYGWKELDGLFKYQTVLDKFRPWTTAYSDEMEFAL